MQIASSDPLSTVHGQASATLACSDCQTTGLVLVRQRPGSAKGVMFITLEDETGVANLVVWAKVFETYRRITWGPE